MLSELLEILSDIRLALNVQNEGDYLTDVSLVITTWYDEMNCSGTHTIFDQYIPRSFNEIDDEFNADTLSHLSISQATIEFMKRFIVSDVQLINVPIHLVKAISASRHGLKNYKNIEEFGGKNYQNYIDDFNRFSTKEYFNYCLEGGLSEGGERFYLKYWAPSLTWSNNGGSHRFSTAYYLAKNNNYLVDIKGSLTSYCLNHDWFDEVNEIYESYLISTQGLDSVHALYQAFNVNKQEHSTIIEVFSNNYWCQENENRIFILLLKRSIKVPSGIIKWIEINIKNNLIIDFYEFIQELKDVELKSMMSVSSYVEPHSNAC